MRRRKAQLQVEEWPIERLTEHPANAREHPPEQIEILRQSLHLHAYQKPKEIHADGRILAGHGLEIAAQLEGLETVPVHVYDRDKPLHYLWADNEAPKLARDHPLKLHALTVEIERVEGITFDRALSPPEALRREIEQDAGSPTPDTPAGRSAEAIASDAADRLRAIAQTAPEQLARAAAVILPTDGAREALIITDPSLHDIAAEIRRRHEAGETSPLDGLFSQIWAEGKPG